MAKSNNEGENKGKTKRGAKGKYSKQIVKDVCEVLKEGMTDKTAYDYVKISHDTFYKWVREIPEFSEAIARARAEGKFTLHQVVTKASEDDWRAAAWILSHRWSEEYSEKSQVEHKGSVNRFEAMTKEQLDEYLRENGITIKK